MTRRIRVHVGLALVAIIGVALLFRALPLYWSSLPSTLDGFKYAALAERAVQTGQIPFEGRADNLFFTTVLGSVSLLTGVDVLRITQPVASIIGTASVLVGIIITRRVVTDSSRLSVNRTNVSLVAGGLLAVEGLFLRRTSVPDEEILGILLTLVVAISLHYAFRSGEARWYLIALGILAIFPLLHTFTSFVVGLVVTGLTVRHVSRTLSIKSLVGGLGIAGGFWAHIALYYRTAETSLSLTVPYVDRVTAYPGLFLGWVSILLIVSVWIAYTDTRIRQGLYIGALSALFGVLIVNTLTPVFPGTVTTPPTVGQLVLVIGVVSLIAVGGLDILSEYQGASLLTALFFAPATIIGFSLTASLTPEYFATAMRAQTFLHLPMLVVVAIALGKLLETDRVLLARVCVAALFMLAAVSAPLAYLNMDTGSSPSTTLESEYDAVAFASTEWQRSWTGDHSITRVGGHQFNSGDLGPTARWLTGGSSPQCAAISQRSWTTTGAHLFPSSPETVNRDSYHNWLAQRHVIYSNTGTDPVRISTATLDAARC